VISLDYGMEYVIIFSSFHFVTIDYKFKDGHFPMSAICVTISKSESLSSNETKVNTKKLKKKSTHLIELDVRKPLVIHYPIIN
jgi:hypothetical protein